MFCKLIIILHSAYPNAATFDQEIPIAFSPIGEGDYSDLLMSYTYPEWKRFYVKKVENIFMDFKHTLEHLKTLPVLKEDILDLIEIETDEENSPFANKRRPYSFLLFLCALEVAKQRTDPSEDSFTVLLIRRLLQLAKEPKPLLYKVKQKTSLMHLLYPVAEEWRGLFDWTALSPEVIIVSKQKLRSEMKRVSHVPGFTTAVVILYTINDLFPEAAEAELLSRQIRDDQINISVEKAKEFVCRFNSTPLSEIIYNYRSILVWFSGKNQDEVFNGLRSCWKS